jgi:hypothetical protein
MDIQAKLKQANIKLNDFGQIHKKDISKLISILKGKEVLGYPLLVSSTNFQLKKILDNEESNKKMYLELMGTSRKKEIMKLPPNGQLFELGHKLFAVDNASKQIIYYVQYELKHFKKILMVTQIAIWLEYLSDYINLPNGERISKYVFFEILLPLADAIMTDALQTNDGNRFWMNMTREALSHGMFVYAILKDKNAIKRINSISELRNLKDEIWGRQAAHENRKLIISTKELF